MNNPILTKCIVAAAAIAAHRIVIFAGDQVTPATGVADKGIGVTDDLDVVAGEPVDVHTHGIVSVTYGGAVTAGNYLTSSADGKAVEVSAGTDVVIGQAMVTGVDGDIGSIKL